MSGLLATLNLLQKEATVALVGRIQERWIAWWWVAALVATGAPWTPVKDADRQIRLFVDQRLSRTFTARTLHA
jgi:hypothetical protein